MFSILHPGLFLAGVACVAIPIIIHLLRRKRKPVTWGAMRFLEQAYRKRKRILTIEQLILLALRCALVLLLATGIGGLMLGSASTSSQPVALTIVLDNSIGSALRSSDGSTALDRSKAAALGALDDLDPARGDRAALITLGAPASALVIHPSTDLDSIRALIGSTAPVDSAPDLPGMIDLLNAQDTPEESTTEAIAFASSFRGYDARSFPPESRTTRFNRILAQSPDSPTISNIGIRAITPSRSLRLQDTTTALPITVRVAIERSGTLPEAIISIALTDRASGQALGNGTINWASGEAGATAFIAVQPQALSPLRAGSAAITATIDSDANTHDNTHRAIVSLRQSLRVGVIEADDHATEQAAGTIRASRALRAALSPNPSASIDLVLLDHTRLSAQKLNTLDALFVLTPDALDEPGWGMLASANRSGLSLLITPGAHAPTASWTGALDAFGVPNPPASLVPAPHDPPITLSEDLPRSSLLGALTSEYPALTRSASLSRSVDLGVFAQATPIANTATGAPLAVQLHSTHPGRGAIVLLSTALDFSWTDLPARPLFVPIMQELVRQSVGLSRVRPQLLAGQPGVSTTEELTPLDQEGDASLRIAGLYAALDADGATRALVAVNPDADGARTTPIPEPTLAGHLTRMFQTESIDWISTGQSDAESSPETTRASITPSFGFAGLLFLLAAAVGVLELILARVFSFRDQAVQSGSSA